MKATVPLESRVMALLERAQRDRRPLLLRIDAEPAPMLPRVVGQCTQGLPIAIAEELTLHDEAALHPRYSGRLRLIAWPLASQLASAALPRLPQRSPTPVPAELLRAVSRILCAD